MNDANDRVKDAGEEFSPTNPTPTVSLPEWDVSRSERRLWSSISTEAYRAIENGMDVEWDISRNHLEGWYEYQERGERKVFVIYGRLDDEQTKSLKDSIETHKHTTKIRRDAALARSEAKERAVSLRSVPDLAKRAGSLFAEQQIEYKDVKKVRSGDSYVAQAQNTDANKFIIISAMFGFDPNKADGCKDGMCYTKAAADANRPHRDTFRGRIVDHEGNVIDDHYPVVAWIRAFDAAKLRGVSAENARKALAEWAKEHRWNDLTERLADKITAHDGKPRMDDYLVSLFKCRDTELNREFSRYFWLSLYMRLMHPGSFAPMVLSLFGAQSCGKSYFGKRLARIITGDETADSVQLNLAGDKTEFLREITGNSVIASIGEMTGFTTGDLNKIKDFVTRTSDKMHYKFEGHFDQQRQWVCVMDGNRYEGLQRDATGNRRFYPMFCGQLEDRDGQPHWSEDFNAGQFIHSDQFEADVWQLLAEAKEWIEDYGDEGYSRFVDQLVKKVTAFNAVERAANRGTVHDPDVDTFLMSALAAAQKRLIKKRDGSGRTGVVVRREDLILSFKDVSKINNPNMKHIGTAIVALGAVEQKIDNRPVYFFDGHPSIAAFDESVGGKSDFEVVESSAGGF